MMREGSRVRVRDTAETRRWSRGGEEVWVGKAGTVVQAPEGWGGNEEWDTWVEMDEPQGWRGKGPYLCFEEELEEIPPHTPPQPPR